MKVTHVAIRPTEASAAAGRPALTPELLAASGARYSRNNEGLDSILARINPDDLDQSVDSIFRMIDYGHQSIADMVPVALFIDGISILLAYIVWSWAPTAGGQESSTRYIQYGRDSLVDPNLLGVPKAEHKDWFVFADACFDAYHDRLSFWQSLSEANPALMRLPSAVLAEKTERARKQIARMRRNYAFDRARYYLPVATKTNIMLIMSARAWTQLCQRLLSHWMPEAVALGDAIRGELRFSAPRLIKHAVSKASFRRGQLREAQEWFTNVRQEKVKLAESPCIASADIFPPYGIGDPELAAALRFYDNRYAFIGPSACRTAIRFSWSAVAMAEIRDLNRHRTGHKYCPLVPVGFYCADDQIPAGAGADPGPELRFVRDHSIRRSLECLAAGNVGFTAWLLLGSQFFFEHTTTLDKFVYEAGLRTGPGAHFRYAAHLRDAVEYLKCCWPETAAAIPLGLAEPE